MQRDDILDWLRETNPDRLAQLWRLADQTRQQFVGDEVHLRGLVEISNHCLRQCAYCGLRAGNAALARYRMNDAEILDSARQAVEFGYGTVVLQSGEDPAFGADRVAALVRRIKAETPLAVTLSLGERGEDELALWRAAGADRYLLRFETSNVELFARIHPAAKRGERREKRGEGMQQNSPRPLGEGPGVRAEKRGEGRGERGERASTTAGPHPSPLPKGEGTEQISPHPNPLPKGEGTLAHPRLHLLGVLRRLGYEVGSGVMIGIPGQTFDDLANDIELFARLDLDMIGVGPYLPHPNTPLAREEDFELGATAGLSSSAEDTDGQATRGNPSAQQVPADELTTCKAIALTRLVCPRANIPATTALATLNKAQGRELGLMRGANVVMPNLTPPRYRALYEIYPDKACIAESGRQCHGCLAARIEDIGRQIGRGRGDSPNYLRVS